VKVLSLFSGIGGLDLAADILSSVTPTNNHHKGGND
jgi:hypothetical protein